MRVFVLNSNKQPLEPCKAVRARILLSSGKAKVFRKYPFTIILTLEVENPEKKSSDQLKLDPGSKTTGIAIVKDNNQVIWGAELTHRGFQIKDALTSRRQLRTTRRNRKTRYRQARFLNRKREQGWLPPSLMSRVHNIMTWVKRLIRYCPISGITQELVKFDTQLMQNAEISGVEYQQGELAGYQIREYLLEKWGRKCAYCSKPDVPLEIEHIKPRSKGGSNRVSNLTLACRKCNQAKGHLPIEQFLSNKPSLLKQILANSKKSLADPATVNATRWKLYEELKSTGLIVNVGSGALTKYNRSRLNVDKTHWLDAACTGDMSNVSNLIVEDYQPLLIAAKGHGTRQICRTDKFGFPTRYCDRSKVHKGFITGDIVKAVVPKGKKIGTYVGRVATRKSGSFNISTKTQLVQGISYKYCGHVHRKDGYQYNF